MPVAHILKNYLNFGPKGLSLKVQIGHVKVKFITATETKRSEYQKSKLKIAES